MSNFPGWEFHAEPCSIEKAAMYRKTCNISWPPGTGPCKIQTKTMSQKLNHILQALGKNFLK